jgi:CDP-glycerol glycerophosphotransferase (TagB/SpsB family)
MRTLTWLPLGSRVIMKLVARVSASAEQRTHLERLVFNTNELKKRQREAQTPIDIRAWAARQKASSSTLGVRGALWSLRTFGTSGIPGSRAATEKFIDLLPFSEEKKSRLLTVIFGVALGNRKPERVVNIVQSSACRAVLAKTGSIDSRLFKDAIDQLAKHKLIHVILDYHAPLPKFLLDRRLINANYVVHSFENRAKQLRDVGLESRARTETLRDKFPDISPQAEETHRFARRLAATVIKSYLSVDDFREANIPQQRAEVFAQGLEDDISWRLSLLECLNCAFREIEKDAPIIFIADGNRFVPCGLPLLLADFDDKRFYFGASGRVAAKSKRFWLDVSATLLGLEPQKTDTGSSVSTSIERSGQQSNPLESATLHGRELAARVSAKLGDRSGEVMFYAPAAKAYTETIEALSRGRGHKPDDALVVISCTTGSDTKLQSEILQSAGHHKAGFDLSSFVTLLVNRKGSANANAEAFSTAFAKANSELLIYNGSNLERFLTPYIIDYLSGKLELAAATYVLAREVARNRGVRGAYTSPGRHWLVRSAAAGFLDSGEGVPLVDVQALNVLDHAKYLPPFANRATVIDTTSARIYEKALGFPGNDIRITGSPRNDAFRDQSRNHDRRQIARQLGLGELTSKRVLLASQLQPFERMAQIARPLAQILKKVTEAELIVKLHPREGDGRARAYQDIFEEAGVLSRVVITHECSPAEAIAASDVCVTIYSNMAREAAIAGIEVVVALYTGWEPPIRMDVEGIAKGAQSEAEFTSMITAALARTAEAATTAQVPSRAATPTSLPAVGSYFADNPHLIDGNSVQAIRDVMSEAIADSPQSRIRQAAAKVASEKLKSAAQQLKADLARCVDTSSPVCVVVEDGLELDDILHVVPDAARATLYINRPGQPSTPLPDNIVVEAGRFNEANRAMIEGAVERADNLARVIAARISECFAGTEVSGRLTELAEPIWLRLRPKLIEAERSWGNLARAAQLGQGNVLVVGQTDQFFQNLAAVAANALAQTTLINVRLDVDEQATVDYKPAHSSKPDEPSDQAASESSQIDQSLLDLVDQWTRGLTQNSFDVPAAPCVIMTTAWNLKTVPGTIQPILERLTKHTNVAAFNLNNAMTDELGSALKDTASSARRTAFGPAQFSDQFPKPSKAGRQLRHALIALIDAMPEVMAAPLTTRAAVSESVDAFARVWLWEILAWAAYCDQAFHQGKAISVACPGRQWHAEVAHIAAKNASAGSITVQNAYMGSGYTYTRPTGEVVTAIDTWSRDLFISAYNVPPEQIVVSSSPRFDYLADLAHQDRAEACAELDLDPAHDLILFAAQEGLEAEARKIVTALASVPVLDRSITIVVKLHPRSPAAFAEELKQLEACQACPHRLVFNRDWPIATALAACDVVLTVYSNVGMEAAAAGKRLIIAKFGDEELPLPLDQFGIGFTAHSGAELTDAVVSYLTDEEFQAVQKERQGTYLKANPLIMSGGSAEMLAELIDQSLMNPAADA